MGRLFWKFFAFIWLAQLCGVVAIAVTYWMSGGYFVNGVADIDAGPAAGVHVSAGSAILQFGGVEAFKAWAARPSRDIVLAVDDAGTDLLGRNITAQVIAHARELHAVRPESPQVADVLTPDRRRLLLFAEARVPNDKPRGSAIGDRPWARCRLGAGARRRSAPRHGTVERRSFQFRTVGPAHTWSAAARADDGQLFGELAHGGVVGVVRGEADPLAALGLCLGRRGRSGHACGAADRIETRRACRSGAGFRSHGGTLAGGDGSATAPVA